MARSASPTTRRSHACGATAACSGSRTDRTRCTSRGSRVGSSHASHERFVRCRSSGRVVGTVAFGGRLARDDLIQIKGTIVEALAGGNYRVKGDNGMEFLAKIGGRMRRYHIRVIPGDRVT